MPKEESTTVVLIVGAGLGGLLLANLLEKAQISYLVIERATKVIPLGSAMALPASILTAFDQLGFMEEILAVSKRLALEEGFDGDLSLIREVDYSVAKEVGGYATRMIARSAMYDILLKRVPKEKIRMSQKVIQIHHHTETEHPNYQGSSSSPASSKGVSIECNNGSIYHSQVLVGADGAHSFVRQSLYKSLDQLGVMPESDKEELQFSSVCLVGQTEALEDLDEFPELKKESCSFRNVVGSGDQPYFWVTFTTSENTVCWMVLRVLNKAATKSSPEFQNVEWGSEGVETMCEEVKDFRVPSGKDGKITTLSGLINRTPKHLISKVMLEEKLFQTWYGHRTVLMGDACHKMNPAAGLGAVNAYHDAIVLANWLSSIFSPAPTTTSTTTTTTPPTSTQITQIFESYYQERFPYAQSAVETSYQFSQLIGKSWRSDMVRTILNRMPRWLWRLTVAKIVYYRPQVSFLPLIVNTGTWGPAYQPSLEAKRPVATATV